MSIKMRNNTKDDAICCNCESTQKQSLNMFDLCIGDRVFTICDECNEKILNKTLRAEVAKNSRLKSQRDLAIIKKRKSKIGLHSGGSINDRL